MYQNEHGDDDSLYAFYRNAGLSMGKIDQVFCGFHPIGRLSGGISATGIQASRRTIVL
jgi:hypothetical protein